MGHPKLEWRPARVEPVPRRPQEPQLVNEPLIWFAVLVHVPLKRYGPVPVVGGFEVFAVPVHTELPAEPVNVVP